MRCSAPAQAGHSPTLETPCWRSRRCAAGILPSATSTVHVRVCRCCCGGCSTQTDVGASPCWRSRWGCWRPGSLTVQGSAVGRGCIPAPTLEHTCWRSSPMRCWRTGRGVTGWRTRGVICALSVGDRRPAGGRRGDARGQVCAAVLPGWPQMAAAAACLPAAG